MADIVFQGGRIAMNSRNDCGKYSGPAQAGWLGKTAKGMDRIGLLRGAFSAVFLIAANGLVAAQTPHEDFANGGLQDEAAVSAPLGNTTTNGFWAGDSESVAGCTDQDGDCIARGCRACATPAVLEPLGVINHLLGEACPRWVAQVDALMLWQGNIASRPLFAQYDAVNDVVGPTALDTNQLQTRMAAGPRYGLFLNVDRCSSIEGNYFNVSPFTGQSSLPNGPFAERNLAGFSDIGVTSPQVLTSARIQSAELNWRYKDAGGVITWLAGFRWVEWNQSLAIQDVPPGAPVSMLNTTTGNDLYGEQFGMDLCLWDRGGRWRVNGVGKAGVFYNNAYQRTVFEQGASGPISDTAKAGQTAFFGEVGLNSSLCVTDWLSWRVGYTLFWLSGASLPANQLSVTNVAPTGAPTGLINTQGSVLLHGVTTGLEARW